MTTRILLIARPERLERQGAEALKNILDRPSTTDGSTAFVRSSLSLRAVSSAHEALELIAEEPFDAAIADLVLSRPGRSGATLLREIKEIRPRCRTLLVTDHVGVTGLVHPTVDAVLFRPENTDWLSAPGLRTNLLQDSADSVSSNGETEITPTLAGSAQGRKNDSTGDLLAGKYRLHEVLGKGGMGVVHRAEDVFIRRPVAIKLLRLEATERTDTVERRMMREVKIAGRLSHPQIVTLHDAGISEERIFLVMELIEGETLSQKLRRGPLRRAEALRVADEILDALDHAHAKGVVHRDLKPANILFTHDDRVKVADFGVAKLVSLAVGEEDGTSPGEFFESHPITLEGAMVGTLSYMAPEQILGDSDARSDLYAVGLLLFEMLQGERFSKHVKPLVRAAELSSPSSDRKPIPKLPKEPALAEILQRALLVRPEERFTTSTEFREALRPLLEQDSGRRRSAQRRKLSGLRRFLPRLWRK